MESDNSSWFLVHIPTYVSLAAIHFLASHKFSLLTFMYAQSKENKNKP